MSHALWLPEITIRQGHATLDTVMVYAKLYPRKMIEEYCKAMRGVYNRRALPARTRLPGMQSCTTKKQCCPHLSKNACQSRARTDFSEEKERTFGSNRGAGIGDRSHQYSLTTRRRTRE